MTATLNRIAFEQSRELEFFDEKELNLQIGTTRGNWALAILKELVDNALDACEKAGIAPCIEIEASEDRLIVADNGPGIPAEVIDIGLRMGDIEAMQLESEPVTYQDKKDLRILLRQQGWTEAEVNMLVSGGRPKDWNGHRVELNAMDSRQFIDWLEAKLKQHGVEKVVPDLDTLKQAYQRAAYIRQINQAIAEVIPREVAIPDDLEQRVKAGIDQDAELPWESIIWDIAAA